MSTARRAAYRIEKMRFQYGLDKAFIGEAAAIIEDAIAAETEQLRSELLGYIETHGTCTLALRKIKAALEQKGGE